MSNSPGLYSCGSNNARDARASGNPSGLLSSDISVWLGRSLSIEEWPSVTVFAVFSRDINLGRLNIIPTLQYPFALGLP